MKTPRTMRIAIMDMEVRARWAACIRVMAVNMARIAHMDRMGMDTVMDTSMSMGMDMGIIGITVTRGAEVGVDTRATVIS